jgi:hypothetical protein
MNIYISKNNQTLGPYNEEQITQMIDAGSIGVHDMCSLDGSTWQHVSDFIQVDEQPKPQPKQIVKPSPTLARQTKGISKPPRKASKPQAKARTESSRKPENNRHPKDARSQRHHQSNQVQKASSNPATKKSYLSKIRSESLYPTLRLFFKIFFFIEIAIGIIMIIGGIATMAAGGFSFYLLTPLLGGIILIFFAFLTKESGEVIIDIADSLIENNSKNN